MAMITGAWGATKLVCGNHPEMENPPEMIIQAGPHSLFYACPKYDILNREDYEAPCMNRISGIDYEKMLEHIADVIQEADANDETPDLTNHKWTRKGTDFKILKYSDREIVVSMRNKIAIQGHIVR